MTVQDTIYSSTSVLAEGWEENEVKSITDFGDSLSKNLNFIKKVFGINAIKVDSIEITFSIKTSVREQPIGLTDSFWLDVALGKVDDSSPN